MLLVQDSFQSAGSPLRHTPASPEDSFNAAASEANDGNDLASALEELRRAGGPLADLSDEAQTLLLGGTLFQYSTAAPATSLEVRERPVTPGNDFSATLGLLEAQLFSPVSARPQTPLSPLEEAVEAGPAPAVAPAPTSTPASAALTPRPHAARLATPASAAAGGIQTSATTSFAGLSFEETRVSHATITSDMNMTASTTGALGGDGDFTSMLQRLVRDGALGGIFSRSARNVMQMSTVLTGQRLTEAEIQDLPKVRFDKADEQTCAICLEAYKQGDLLNALGCNHAFHMDCLARWLQRSTQCPLCRTSCGT